MLTTNNQYLNQLLRQATYRANPVAKYGLPFLQANKAIPDNVLLGNTQEVLYIFKPDDHSYVLAQGDLRWELKKVGDDYQWKEV